MNTYLPKRVNSNQSFSQGSLLVETVSLTKRPQDIVRTWLSHCIKTEILEDLVDSVKPVMYNRDKVSDVYFYGPEKFNDFSKFAVRSDTKDTDTKETFLLGNVLYTTHQGFSIEDTPYYKTKDDKPLCNYKSDKIYCVRLIHYEKSRGKRVKVDEIIIYLPNSSFVV